MSVTIVCHRGWWEKPEEQNTIAAFARAFDAGLGVELDVRDCFGGLVVSHDPPNHPAESDPSITWFWEVLDLLGDRPNVLAVNVKACGLAPLFAAVRDRPKNWFFFDLQNPDWWEYSNRELPVYFRVGPKEPLSYYETCHADGAWVDPGKSDWLPADLPLRPFVVVSPELHGEAYQYTEMLWGRLSNLKVPFSLCTDRPREAMEFFK